MRYLDFEIERTKGERRIKGKPIIIKGYANLAVNDQGKPVIDRGNEHIPSEEWDVEEYLQNPILLFNHNRDVPIGRCFLVEVRPKGLYIEAEISESESPEIKKARDLIMDEVLRTLSVGIDSDEEEIAGVTVLRNVKLLEVSVVSLPMNIGSTFEISQKMLAEEPRSRLAAGILREKGAAVAARINDRLAELEEQDEAFDRAEVLTEIAQRANISLEEFQDILSGRTGKLEDTVISLLSSELGMDQTELADLNSSDQSAPEKPASDQEEVKADGEPLPDDQEDSSKPLPDNAPTEDDELPEEEKAAPDDEELPEGQTAPDASQELPEDSQDVQKAEELAQALEDEPKAEGGDMAAMHEGMMEAFEADVTATETEGPGNPAAWVGDEAKWEQAKKVSMDSYGELRWDFITWVYLNRLNGAVKPTGGQGQEKKCKKPKDGQKSADVPADPLTAGLSEIITRMVGEKKRKDEIIAAAMGYAKEKASQLTQDHWKMILAPESKQASPTVVAPQTPTQPVSTVAATDPANGGENASLNAAQQTNVLLAQVISELQKLQKQVEGLTIQPQAPVAPQTHEVKSLDIIGRYRENLDQRLKSLDL